MSENVYTMGEPRSADEAAIRGLYEQVLDGWNRRSGDAYAAPFAEDAEVIGFDGSQMTGRTTIASEIGQIFENHNTGTYVGKIRSVRFLTPGVAVLRAVSGVKPPGQNTINPAVNSIQTLIAAKSGAQWRVAHFQNTPAQFHGRPELSQKLTEELQELG